MLKFHHLRHLHLCLSEIENSSGTAFDWEFQMYMALVRQDHASRNGDTGAIASNHNGNVQRGQLIRRALVTLVFCHINRISREQSRRPERKAGKYLTNWAQLRSNEIHA